MLTVAYGVVCFLGFFFEIFKVLGYDGDVGLCNTNYENASFQNINTNILERMMTSYAMFTLQFL